MKNCNGGLEKMVDSVGWGLFLILIGGLIFADNKGWLNGYGWLYFIIGIGIILVFGSLVRYFVGHNTMWSLFGGLVVGLALIYIGIAFLNGLGNWWPMALVIIGAGCLLKGFLSHKSESHTTHN